jgi:hypothetical protein
VNRFIKKKGGNMPKKILNVRAKLLDEAELQVKKIVAGADGRPVEESFVNEP